MRSRSMVPTRGGVGSGATLYQTMGGEGGGSVTQAARSSSADSRRRMAATLARGSAGRREVRDRDPQHGQDVGGEDLVALGGGVEAVGLHETPLPPPVLEEVGHEGHGQLG